MLFLTLGTVYSAARQVEAAQLQNSKILMSVGDQRKIVVEEHGLDIEVTWKSENTKVATVKEGMVTAVEAGKTKIQATTKDKTFTCEVVVEKAIEGTSKIAVSNNSFHKDYQKNNKLVGTVCIDVPKIKIEGNKKAEKKINVFFKAEKKAALKDAAEIMGYAKIDSINTIYGYDQDFQIVYHQGEVMVVDLYNYQYSGGAHPNYFREIYVFDTTTGQQIGLLDLAGSKKNLAALEQKILSLIEKQIKDGNLEEKGAYYPDYQDALKAGIKDGNFGLTGKFLYVVYNPYEIAPYASGEQIFEIPITEVFSLFAKEMQTKLVPDIGEAAGKTAKISLEANPSTGYSWKYKFLETGIVQEVKAAETVSEPDTEDRTGVPIVQVWEFVGLKEGSTEVTFTYQRAWESKQSEKTVRYKLTVASDKTVSVTEIV